jgi:hypothetical protein
MATQSSLSARDRRIMLHSELAKKAFSNHVITERLNSGMFRSWRCQAPGTWCYGFDVTTMPGTLVVTGDIGTLVVERTNDMIAWASGAARSIDYFAEKVSREMPTREWDADVAAEFIDQSIAGCEDDEDGDVQREAWRNLKEDEIHDETTEQEFCMALIESELIDGCDFPDLTNWKPSFLWCREAVIWFLQNFPA